MKRIIVIFSILAPLCAGAQFNKGDKYVGGSLGISTQHQAPTSPFSVNTMNKFSINPSAGVLLNSRWAVGGVLDISYEYSASSMVTLNTTTKSLGAGVFGRRYFPISEKIFFTLIGQIIYGRGVIDQNQTGTQRNYTLTASVTPGFMFFPSRHLALELDVAGISNKYEMNLSEQTSSNVFNFNAGSVSMSVFYYFRKE